MRAFTVRLNNLRVRHLLFLHRTISKHCCWVAFLIFHGDNNFDESFEENNYVLFRLKKVLLCLFFYKMSRKVTVMDKVNNFASVNFGHCGKSKHFALDLPRNILGISLGDIPWFQNKMFGFSTMPSNK